MLAAMLAVLSAALALPPNDQHALSPSAVSLSSAPTHATTLAATDPVSLLLVDYYERMTAQRSLHSARCACAT